MDILHIVCARSLGQGLDKKIDPVAREDPTQTDGSWTTHDLKEHHPYGSEKTHAPLLRTAPAAHAVSPTAAR